MGVARGRIRGWPEAASGVFLSSYAWGWPEAVFGVARGRSRGFLSYYAWGWPEAAFGDTQLSTRQLRWYLMKASGQYEYVSGEG